MMNSDESRTEQPAQPAEPPQEAQRNLHLLSELAQKFDDGTALAAGGYVGKRIMETVFGGKDSGKPEPPSDPPPSQAD
jgi:hypothetical protein